MNASATNVFRIGDRVTVHNPAAHDEPGYEPVYRQGDRGTVIELSETGLPVRVRFDAPIVAGSEDDAAWTCWYRAFQLRPAR